MRDAQEYSNRKTDDLNQDKQKQDDAIKLASKNNNNQKHEKQCKLSELRLDKE